MPAIKMQEWSPTKCGKVLGLVAGGRHSLREITKIINLPKTTVYDIKKRGTGITKPRPGCPKLLDDMTLRRVVRHIKSDKKTRRQSLQVLIGNLHLNISAWTL